MTRKFLFSICFLLASFSIAAAPLDGIRIEREGQPIIVLIDGQQVCTPTLSCFIANLRRGSYRVEVYAARHENNLSKENLLYDERVFCSGMEVKEIVVDSRNRPEAHPHRPGAPDFREQVMRDREFKEFVALLKKQPFDSDRKEVFENGLLTSYFTTAQCIQLLDMCTFSSEKKSLLKKMYPKIADKSNFIHAIDKLDFSTDKREINDFIKSYHNQNR